ncbi:MAG: hypothetical protein ABIJ20_02885 [Nanoarchaeota archaeon]|nr:hypothetical protein [Nanoarchaeota archaeon]MBU1445481.1 hypothetical protein [Nanoarchaeota archaeon]MBU2420436.1 hypothetical protein [Nanoarchaeota archaeon]MBU2475652.1 hypothetical protein [Nanoarchaeota archaeon]
MDTLEAYLRTKLAEDEVVIVNEDGLEFKFDSHELRNEYHDFCFLDPDGLVVQLPYRDIKKWRVKEPKE